MKLEFNNKSTNLLNITKFNKSVFYVFLFFVFIGNSQVLINEASNKNLDVILDEDTENEDWIELFNSSDNLTNIKNWSITDNKSNITKWIFPNTEIPSKSHVLIYASGKDRGQLIHGENWESAILPTDTFNYLVPNATTPTNWNTLDFDVSSWNTGSASFGYDDEDNDHSTMIPEGTLSVYIRKTFNVTDVDALISAICHVDYDDAFVAYINGVEICRANIDGEPLWNSTSIDFIEPLIVNGEDPEEFEIDANILTSVLQQGENLFAIEVHNTNAQSSDLTLIPYLSFSFDGDNTYFSEAPDFINIDTNAELHTNFKISGEGETVYLYNASQVLVDSMVVNIQSLNHSYGRDKDGSNNLATFSQATPGTSNNNSTAYIGGYEEIPSFDIPAGIYNNSIDVSLSVPSDEIIIRYTLDGSEPTTSSTIYSKPLTLSSSISINARSFGTSGKLPSIVNTHTYIVNENFTVPILSVTTDSNNLFGDDGIFTNNQEEWNRPCYIEYFEEDGTLAFSQKSGIQVDGGAGGSRTQPQTSFRIEPSNGTYGANALEYNFHPNRPNRTHYESLYLRNGSNRYLDLFYKDASQVRAMGQNTNNFYSEYRPIVVFINGSYYGMYEGREKINADYLESNYNIDTNSLDMVGISHFKNPRTILANEGSTESFFEDYNKFLKMDTSSETYLDEVGKFLDLDNYTDYIAAQTWMTNKDWPHNNMKAWRCVGTDMRWQFALIDLEWSFLPTGNSTRLKSLPNFDQIEFMNENGTDWPASGYWFILMQNEDYKHRFINRLCDLMNTNYTHEKISEIETKIFEEAWPEIPANYERWNGGDPSEFQRNHIIFNNQLSIREPYLRQHLREHYNLNNDVEITLDVTGSGKTKISSITPDNYPWNGDYFSDTPITIEAIPNPGYKFVTWEDNNLIDDLTKSNITVELETTTANFVAIFELDTDPFTDITITEINYKKGTGFDTTDWFEIYNGSNNTVSLEGWYFSDSDLTHRYDFDSQTTIKSEGYLVVAKSLKKFIENYPYTINTVGNFDFGLGTTDAINLYNANNELIVKVEYSDESPWPLNRDDSGKTLELTYYSQDQLSNPLSWFDGCIMGSPGSAFNEDCIIDIIEPEPSFTDLIITEINYKESLDFNSTDWFEIYNNSDDSISLDSWYFSDSDPTHRYNFDKQTTIESGEYLVVTKSVEDFNENYPNTINVVGGFDFGLGTDDTINLYNANSELIIRVTYSDDNPWPLNRDESGRTLELANYNEQGSEATDWFKGCVTGSPGKKYNENCSIDNIEVPNFTDLIITEINYKRSEDFNTPDWFEIYNNSNNSISLDGLYFSDSDPTHRYNFDKQTTIEPGEYLVVTKSLESFNENYPNTINVVGNFDFGLGTDDTINLYNASSELIIRVTYSDDNPWPLNGDETGRTLELANYNKQGSEAAYWFKGCITGSPGKEYNENCLIDDNKEEIEFTDLIITEINYKESEDFNTTDWFEIYNNTNELINLEGWYFSDSNESNRYNFNNQTKIESGKYLIIAKTTKRFIENYPSVTNIVGDFDFGLGLEDTIKLYNINNELKIQVTYSDKAPWVLNEDNTGSTLELVDDTKQGIDVSSWIKGCFKGSPGSVYDENCSDNNGEKSTIVAYPIPAKDKVNLNLDIDEIDKIAITIEIVSLTGKIVKTIIKSNLNNSNDIINLDIDDLKPGLYMLVVYKPNTISRIKLLVK